MSMNNVNGYNVNNYCACTGGTPEYVIKLNQQGPPGPQGEQGLQGPQGVSPEISVYQDTDDTYILQVITATTSFMTPNLMTNANNQINALEQKLQAEIDTKANLTLDNINVANPFNLNGLTINALDSTINLTPSAPGGNITVLSNQTTTIQGTPVDIKSGDNTLRVSGSGVTVNYDTIATQPWVEEQLDGFLTDLPAATTTTLGAVKVQPLYTIDTSKMPQVVMGNKPSDSNTYQKLYVDDDLLPTGGVVIKEEGSANSQIIAKAYLTAKIEGNEASIAGYTLDSMHRKYDPLTSTWLTTGKFKTTYPLVATTTRMGMVKPDGTTITITDDGTISAVGGGGGTTDIINDDVPSATTTYSSNKIDELNGQQNGQITQLVDTVTKLQESVTALRNRVAALEANINGGNA